MDIKTDIPKIELNITSLFKETHEVIEDVTNLETNSSLENSNGDRLLPFAIVGFLSNAITIFSFFYDLFNQPKYTTDDVMSTIDSEFKEIRNQMLKIENQIGRLEIALYKDVELAVAESINDIRFSSSSGLGRRAINLYNKIEYFLNGMLGQNLAGADIFKIVQTMNNVR